MQTRLAEVLSVSGRIVFWIGFSSLGKPANVLDEVSEMCG